MLNLSLNIETPQHNSHLYSTFHSAQSNLLSSPTPWFPVGSMESCWQANRVTWLIGRSHWRCKSQAWASFEFTAVKNPLQTVQTHVRLFPVFGNKCISVIENEALRGTCKELFVIILSFICSFSVLNVCFDSGIHYPDCAAEMNLIGTSVEISRTYKSMFSGN